MTLGAGGIEVRLGIRLEIELGHDSQKVVSY
jgi:hypothetical protein